MKKKPLGGVLLIPWAALFLLFLHFPQGHQAYENRFKSRGASLLQQRSPYQQLQAQQPTYYYYDHVAEPVSLRQRRQRHFSAPDPVVVLRTGRQSPATLQIKELPPLVRTRQGFFAPASPQPTANPAGQTTTSFARFNQFGQTMFNVATSPAPTQAARQVVENRFQPIRSQQPGQLTQQLTSLPQPEAVIGRVPTVPTTPTLINETPRTLFGTLTQRLTTPSSTTLVTPSTTSSQRTTPSLATTSRFFSRTPISTRGLSSPLFQRSTTTTTTTTEPSLIEEQDDPCQEGNHIVIADEPERSANHHLSLGAISSPICDRTILAGWYRFQSPAGNLIPTECPGENYCGTRKPVWLNGTHPNVNEGIVSATGCVVESSEECCGMKLDLAIKNCTDFTVYRLIPPPVCSIGYCAGHRLPCPEGLTSADGFTPCEFPVKLRDVHLKPNNVASTSEIDPGTNEEIVFYCFPMLDGIVDPHTVVVDVEWWVEDQLVIEESFNLKARSSGILQPQFWKMGQTIRCSARARHVTIGTKTAKIFSPRFFAGIQMISPPILRLQPGEQIEEIQFTSSLKPLCRQKRGFRGLEKSQNCCLDIHFQLNSEEKCVQKGLSIHLPKCQMQLCDNNWNETLKIPLTSSSRNVPEKVQYSLTPTIKSEHRQWSDYQLPPIKILVSPSNKLEKFQNCLLSASTGMVAPFMNLKSLKLKSLKSMSIYSLYKRSSGGSDIEVQAQMRSCNLREHCLCALAIRSKTMAVYFDRCTKGFLQVWAKESLDVHVHGIDVMSRQEGRIYEVRLPDGAIITLDPLLTQLKIVTKENNIGNVQGLCHQQPSPSSLRFSSSPSVNLTAYRVEPMQSLFNGIVKMSANITGLSEGVVGGTKNQLQCLLQPNNAQSECLESGDNADHSILTDLLQLGINEDMEPYTRLALEEENELETSLNTTSHSQLQLKTQASLSSPKIRPPSLFEISFSQGPSSEPEDGWTSSAASTYCSDRITSSSAYRVCRNLVSSSLSYTQSCIADLLFSGNSRIASLHLKNLQEDCRQVIETDKSLALSTSAKEDILDSLCLSSCSGHGTCQQGFCVCDRGYGGADCGLDLTQGPHVTALHNLGLCDVRAKPCRDVIVIAEQLATKAAGNDELKCIIEIYKIRGVASKQLVNDAVVSVSGRPLSYEQVLCRLPRLEIHELSDDFDLKDNTDHTQLLVKISLEYSQNGGRSAPLDLLLYDSLCWDCSIDGCQANTKENKCFFATGTSALQIFRIGRTIATRVSPDDAYTCTLPKDSGSCDNKIFRYYYNAIERRCKLFVYGGCKGNGNNFVSEVQCLQKCGDESDLALLPQVEITTEIDICSQKRDSGICPGNVPRFYFDKTLGQCQLFSYGGCGGNSNNFEALDQCVAHCGGPREDVFQVSRLTGSLKPRKSHCNLPLSKGNCQAKLRRFYFDYKEGICKLFIFGGCTGNANNFETMEDCILNCSGPDLGTKADLSESSLSDLVTPIKSVASRLERFKSEFKERKRGSLTPSPSLFLQSTSSSTQTISATEVPNKQSVCHLPKHFGTCLTESIRYFHDPGSNSCRKFRYSGCGGNGNNFLSGEECVRTCGGLLDASVSGPPPSVIKTIITSTTTTTTTSSTSTSTTTTTQSSTTTTTSTTTQPLIITEENEVVKTRIDLRNNRGRNRGGGGVKVRVIQKKRPQITTTSSPLTTSIEVVDSFKPFIGTTPRLRRRNRVRPSSTRQPQLRPQQPSEVEVRTETSVRTATSKSVIMRNNLFAKRNGLLSLNNETDVQPDLDLELTPQLPQVRNFCFKKPMESDLPHCFRPTPLYFYNSKTGLCEAFYKGHCARSRNKFKSVQECQDKCLLVTSTSASKNPSNPSSSTLTTTTSPPRPNPSKQFFNSRPASPRRLFSRRLQRGGKRLF